MFNQNRGVEAEAKADFKPSASIKLCFTVLCELFSPLFKNINWSKVFQICLP